MNIATIPSELRARPQWVLWRYKTRDGKRTKVPFQTNGTEARANDAATWSHFDAVACVAGYDGIGYVFSADDPFFGIDLDSCRHPETGELTPWAADIIAEVGTYAEVSPSETGVKLIGRGSKPDGAKCTLKSAVEGLPTFGDPAKCEIAVYDRSRFWCITGDVLPGHEIIHDRQGELVALLDRLGYLPNGTATELTEPAANRNGQHTRPQPADGQRLASLIEDCRSAPVGQRSEQDYALIAYAIECGMTADELWPQVVGIGKFAERGRAYFDRTWQSAAAKTGPKPQCELLDRPPVILPGGRHDITTAAKKLGELLAANGKHFCRGGAVVCLDGDGERSILRPLKPAALPSDLERVATLQKMGKEGPAPTVCSRATAELILAARSFTAELPAIRVLSQCPLLVEHQGQLVEVAGFHAPSGVLADGPRPEPVALEDAKALILEILQDFQFATPADLSRAVAMILQPAIVLGGLARHARAMVDLSEADQPQTGKGYRNKLTAAIYRSKLATVTQRKSGVGGVEDAISSLLISGATFITLDNVRGKVDSPSIESLLTEDEFVARCAFVPETRIDVRRVCLMLTSNRAELTQDLAQRCCCVRLLKRGGDVGFAQFSEGDILEHVRANQPRYLGAVFAVVRAWQAAGKPRTTETRHAFRDIVQRLDWIVRHIFDLPPMMDGHAETQARMANPHLSWLRDLALAAVRANYGDWLRVNDFVDLLDAAGIDVPGVPEGADIDADIHRAAAWRHVGQRLGKCFAGRAVLELDGIRIERESFRDAEGRDRWQYRFCRFCEASQVTKTAKTTGSPQGPAFPREGPREVSRDPREPREDPELFLTSKTPVDVVENSFLGTFAGDAGNSRGAIGGKCRHNDPATWDHRDGAAHCPGCGKFMGRL